MYHLHHRSLFSQLRGNFVNSHLLLQVRPPPSPQPHSCLLRAASVRKVVRQVKPVPGIFSGLSEKIQNWKWPPAVTAFEEEKEGEDVDRPTLDEPPPLPPPPLPSSSHLEPSFPASSSQRTTRPKSATSFLSESDTSYLYPLNLEDLESVGTPPPGSSHPRPSSSPMTTQQPSRRRHSFSVDTRRKIQLHPTIVQKRMSEEDAATPSSRLVIEPREAQGNSVRCYPTPPSEKRVGEVHSYHLNPSLEMLAADDFDAHYRSSPEQSVATPRGEPERRRQGSQEPSVSPSSFSPPPKTPASRGALFEIFSVTPSRDYEMDFASTLEKELESFRVAHDLHEVSPPESLGKVQAPRGRRVHREGRDEEREDQSEDALNLHRERCLPQERHHSPNESWNESHEQVPFPLPLASSLLTSCTEDSSRVTCCLQPVPLQIPSPTSTSAPHHRLSCQDRHLS